MALTFQELRRLVILALMVFLLVLSFLVLKPILLSIMSGLILAYVFFPIYKKVYKIFREKNTSAFIVCIIIVLIIFIPIWFLIPIVIQQAFDAYSFTQTIDIGSYVSNVFPTATDQFRKETTAIVINFIGDITTGALSALTKFLLDLPGVLLQAAVIIFVFFFSLRDNDKLRTFVSGLSPIKRENEIKLIKKFKEITSSIIYGHVVVGIIQGIATGIGLLLFGIPQAIILTILAIFASIIPFIGPWLVWVPAVFYLLALGKTGAALGFTVYSIIIVSLIDNILRPYIVARKTGTSSVIILLGMIGGLLVFGIIGLILGPLIISYMIILLDAYRDRTIDRMFHSD